MEIDMEAEITPVLLDEEFKEWLRTKLTDQESYEKMLATIEHFNGNRLIARFVNKNDEMHPGYIVYIKGPTDDDRTEILFDFSRHDIGSWCFEILIGAGILLTNASGGEIDMTGKGYSRLLMLIMHYCLEKKVQEKPTDLTVAGDELLIGIDADASDGFWKHMGMKEGKYSMEGDRRNSSVGAAVGFEKEFQMKDWKRWLFSDSNKRARSKNKKKSKKHKKKKNTKRKKKRKSKRKIKKSKMR